LQLHHRGKPFPLAELRAALEAAGAQFLELTNEWEVLRYRLTGKVGVIYRNKKGAATPTGAAGAHLGNLRAGRPIAGPSFTDEKRIARATNPTRKVLTLYTDASCYDKTGASSWAAILVEPNGAEHEASGPLKGVVGSSIAAEARAVANALHHFSKAGLITANVRVITDCLAVVDKLRASSTKSRSPQIAEALEHIAKISAGRFTVLADWVKGHQTLEAAKSDPRVAYNRRCDALARAHSYALHKQRQAAREALAEAEATDAHPAQECESVSHVKQELATSYCVVAKERAGPPMTGNPALARELKPHTQEELTQ
jgi:ribonuclease HI